MDTGELWGAECEKEGEAYLSEKQNSAAAMWKPSSS